MTVTDMPVKGEVTLTHAAGLHARPAVKLTKLAKTFNSTIDLATKPEGPWTDVKSVAKVMAMKVPKNSILHFRASGDDADQAVAALIALIDHDFDEAQGHD
ncbi:MAG: HPr family phosphocarrier protein [Dongiaceae bacterium]